MQSDSLFQEASSFDLSTLLRRAAHSCEVQLCVYGGLSALVYWLAFTRGYSLGEWWMTTNRTIAKLANFAPGAGLSYTLAMAALFGLYLLALRCARFESNPRVLATIAAVTVILNVPLLGLYPVDSADVFDNIVRGRMTLLYGLNPFVATPQAVSTDPFYWHAAWKLFPSAYGPLWEWLAASGAWLAGNGVVANVLVFKLLSVAAYVGTAALVVLMLRRLAPERAAYGAVFVLWNPLMLYSTAGNGHNDAVMIFFAALGFFLLMRRKFTLAVLAVLAGALIKFIPVLLIPLILLAALQALPDWRARLRFLVVTGLACAALSALGYARFWEGKFVNLDWRWDLYTTSLSTWAWLLLQNGLDAKFAALLVSRAGYILLAAWIVRELRVLWRQPASRPDTIHRNSDSGTLRHVITQAADRVALCVMTCRISADERRFLNSSVIRVFPRSSASQFGMYIDVEAYVRAALSILLFYLLVATTWFQPWYVVWLLPFAALVPPRWLARGTLLLCAAALAKMPFFDFLLVRDLRPVPPAWWREVWLTLAVLAAPWTYFLLGWWKRKHLQQ